MEWGIFNAGLRCSARRSALVVLGITLFTVVGKSVESGTTTFSRDKGLSENLLSGNAFADVGSGIANADVRRECWSPPPRLPDAANRLEATWNFKSGQPNQERTAAESSNTEFPLSGISQPQVSTKTYYTYKSGPWDDPDTWTTDPGGTTIVGSAVPADGDDVVILTNRTVSLNANVATSNLDISINDGGILDLGINRFTHTSGLASLSGTGLLRIASAYFPLAANNSFVLAGGGTTEFCNRADFTLPANQSVYNNLSINTIPYTATLLSNITVNGNLNVRSGTFMINSNTGITKLNLTVNGDVIVSAAGEVKVGQGSTNSSTVANVTGGVAPFTNYYESFHRVVIGGSLYNNGGTVKFTNLTQPLYGSFPPTGNGATSGAATVYFTGAANASVVCNGVTNFYNLVLDKVDQSVTLTVIPSQPANFALYGANNMDFESSGDNANPNLRKALWIRTGSLVLKGATVIPSLTEGTAVNSDYFVPNNGALILDGPDVVVLSTADEYREVNVAYGTAAGNDGSLGINRTQWSSLGIIGIVQVNDGYLSTRESGGISFWGNSSGQLIINGGVVDTKQIADAVAGNAGLISYTQNGGMVYLRGRMQHELQFSTVRSLTNTGVNTARTAIPPYNQKSTFSVNNNTSSGFTMTGGEIRIYDTCTPDGTTYADGAAVFTVNSPAANNNVTGGTITLIPTNGTSAANTSNFYLSTTAPLGNITIERNANSAAGIKMATDVTALGNVSLNAGSLDAGGKDLYVGGNFTIENGTSYSNANSTIFNGSGNQTFTVNIAAPLSLNELKVEKDNHLSQLNLAGSQSTINVAGMLTVTKGMVNLNGKTVNAQGDVFNSGTFSGTGKLSLVGTSVQNIEGDGKGVFGNMEINNTNGSNLGVMMLAGATVTGQLTFTSNNHLFIGPYRLMMTETASFVNAGAGDRYIVTLGQSGDGGLTMKYSASKLTNTFYIGSQSDNRQSPDLTKATIGFSTAPSTFGEVTVIPVGYEHPATTATGKSLGYFWRVKSSGFPASLSNVTHSFTYQNADVQGTENRYLPAFYSYSNNRWNQGVASNINKGNNTISDWTSPTNSSTMLDGDYTAGEVAAFGTPLTYYSRKSGIWGDNTTWSTVSHTGASASAVPGVNDVVIIGNGNTVTLNSSTTTQDTDVRSCAILKIEKGATFDVGYNPSSNFKMILNHPNGNGNLRITTSAADQSTFNFPYGDFSEFNENLGTTELYTTNPNAGTTFWFSHGVTSFGNLIISPLGGSNVIFPNNDLLIYGDLTIRGQDPDSWFCPTWSTRYPDGQPYSPKTITVKGNMKLEGGSFVWYPFSGVRLDLAVDGDIEVSANAGLFTYSNQSGDYSLYLGGSLINNTAGWKFTRSTSQVDLGLVKMNFIGTNNAEIKSISGNPRTTLGKVTVDKGTSPATTLRCSIGGTFTTPSDNWLTLKNGTFIYETAKNLTLSQGTTFSIPATSALVLNTGSTVGFAQIGNNVHNSTSGILLGGKLTIRRGTVNIGNGNNRSSSCIEYASGGFSEIEIAGGTVNINGQIRRNPLNSAGILKYTQSGGTLNITGNRRAGVPNASFEIVNAGSAFNMSNGTINFIKGGGGSYAFGDMFIRPDASSVTGGTINFGTTTTQSYHIDASVPLNNVTIYGNGGTATVNLMVNPLVLNGYLQLSNTNSILKTNNVDVSLKGDFVNNGSESCYLYGTNTTTFNGNTQDITGTGITNFNNLVVNPLTSLSLSKDVKCNDLSILSGTFVMGTLGAEVRGDLNNDSRYTDTGKGIKLTGGSTQHRISGTGSFGNLVLDDSNGAKLTNSITLEGVLKMTTGILDINSNQLTIGLRGSIVADGSPFSAAKMITTEGVFSNLGIQKVVNTGQSVFNFPLGSGGKYTPAELQVTSNTSVGSVRINGINDKHPSVITTVNDKALQYYWEVESIGISGFRGSMIFSYNDADVVGNDATYIAAKMAVPGHTWAKSTPPNDNVNEAQNKVTFPYTGATSISGEYTAGEDPAYPAVVATFTTIKDGDWSDKTIWSPTAPDGGPNGYIAIVNHTVDVTNSATSSYRTEINGKLKIDPKTLGHNFGTVTGGGTLYLENGIMPAGRFTAFFDCNSNSTLEYGGTSDYTIIADLYSRIPRLVFSGTGVRYYPNKNLTVCKLLEIDGPILDNTVANKSLTLLGEMVLKSGGFRSGSGPDAKVVFAGTEKQKISTGANAFVAPNNLHSIEIDNPKGLDLEGGLEIDGDLFLTRGVINTTAANAFTITNPRDDCIIPAEGKPDSYINGPLTKLLNTGGDYFVFPVGNNRQGYQLSLKATFSNSFLWTVQYFGDNPTFRSFNSPIAVVNSDEYWKVSVPNAATGLVKIGWNTSSGLTPAMTVNGIQDMRIAEYRNSAWNEIGTTATGGNDNGAVATSAGFTFGAGSSYDFTSASVTAVRPKAKMAPAGAVCGNAGIPVSIFANGMSVTGSYSITYSLDGVTQPVLNFTGLPITIPTQSPGEYKLIAFTYNSGAGQGVVDANTAVTVNANPTIANAGLDQSLCGANSAWLTANTPATGRGLWTVESGAGGTFDNPTSPSTNFYGSNGSVYTVRWTIDNGGCTSYDEIQVNLSLRPNAPVAVSPQNLCTGATLADVAVTTASGATLKWYGSAAGGAELQSSTLLVTNTTYYAEADNGCVSAARTPVRVVILPDVSVSSISVISPSVEPKCKLTSGVHTTEYTATVSNGASYEWSIDNNTRLGSIDAATGVMTWANNQTGNVNIKITAKGCGADAVATRKVVINPPPTPELKVLSPVCAGVKVTVELTKAYAGYLWSVTTPNYSLSDTGIGTPDLQTPTNDQLFPVTSTSMESYPDVKVVVTDSNGCTGTTQNNSTLKKIRVVRIPRTGPPFHIGNSVSQ